MAWWQFSLNCQASELELVEDLMQELGALSLSISDAGDEPIYEPLPGTTPLWKESVVTATFDTELDPEFLYQQISSALPTRLVASLHRHSLQERDWEQAYKQHFQPIQCAPGLWIVPSWSEPPEPQATVIVLDPGLAFGTGSHPTTALCLAWLASNPPTGSHVIDYGCGSGILAIAALKLGAEHVLAVDIDAQALTACRANARANHIDAGQIQISTPENMDDDPTDLLVANILAGPLVELAPRFASLVRPGGYILLSGILKSQLEDIQLAYQSDFTLARAEVREDWVCLSGQRI
ncbi:MAG: 50S ribosomal protein L11 methyltransferase [Gammaproteobacteria bacterium]|nr:MAG: 50S ribosomal protein L11 methyltransferase [Gammaproteobacteria bacterium]